MVGRNTTAGFKSEISNDVIRPRLFIEAEFTSGTIYVWNGVGDFSWNSHTWNGLGEFLGISDVAEDTEIKVFSITITFQALSAAYKALALSNVELKNTITVYLGLLDSTGAIVADPETLFTGYMDEVNLEENGDMATFNLRCVNRLAILQKSKDRRYTNQDQINISGASADTSLEHMVNVERESTWGDGIGQVVSGGGGGGK